MITNRLSVNKVCFNLLIQDRIGQAGVDALTAVYGTPFTLGSIGNVLCKLNTNIVMDIVSRI